MQKKGAAFLFMFLTGLFLMASIFFALPGAREDEWENQTMLRMSVPYERSHPTGLAAEYFAGLVKEKSRGTLEIAVTYDTEPGSEKEIVTQLQFGGIAVAAVNYLNLCEEIPEINRFIGTYASPEEAQAGVVRQKDEIQEYFSKERMELLSCYRPDYRCIASKEERGQSHDFTGMKLHATKASELSLYLLKLGAELESYERTDLLRSVAAGVVDGAEMPLLLYQRAGYDKVMPYVWIYQDLLVPDLLVASTVSLGNLTDEQQRLLQDCARETEEFQVGELVKAQEEQLRTLGDRGISTEIFRVREQDVEEWN